MSRALGAAAEARAARFLQDKGYRIVARNWTCRGGELDLVCEHQDTLIFVEVRARADERHGTPVETVGDVKRRRLIHAARLYLARASDAERACRFDVIALVGDTIEHYEDAFTT
jgi:putative endonuclease